MPVVYTYSSTISIFEATVLAHLSGINTIAIVSSIVARCRSLLENSELYMPDQKDFRVACEFCIVDSGHIRMQKSQLCNGWHPMTVQCREAVSPRHFATHTYQIRCRELVHIKIRIKIRTYGAYKFTPYCGLVLAKCVPTYFCVRRGLQNRSALVSFNWLYREKHFFTIILKLLFRFKFQIFKHCMQVIYLYYISYILK